jgi:PIN domain nuclease of toxin-antitoxin system
LTDVAIQAIEDPASKVFISVASLWEMTVKVEIGKLNLGFPVRTIMTTYARNGALILTINPGHVFATQNLLWHHRDPFGRILIAQAISEGLTLISCDEVFKHY